MNKDNASDYLPLVQALAEGKTIQVREFWNDDSRVSGEWTVINDTNFTYPPEHYRIKPEPREFWIFEETMNAFYFPDKEITEDMEEVSPRYIHVREVLDDE